MTTRIGLATADSVPALTEDGQRLQASLRDLGFPTEPVVWTDQQVDGSSFDVLVLRSCWDYHTRPDAFEEWLATAADAGVTVLNPLSVVRWNLHKFYLRDLAERGVRIPDTVWVERGSDVSLSATLRDRGWEQAVVKPAVATSSAGLWRTSLADADAEQRRFESMTADEDVLVQRFLPEVSKGERSLVFVGGEYSHAFVSIPASSDFRAHPNFGGETERFEPSRGVVAEAKSVLERAADALDCDPDAFRYARVDGVERDGEFYLMELELIEPFLNLKLCSDASERLARAIESAVA